MKSDKKTLLENFISLGALQIVNYIVPLISLPYLSRVLGVEKFGLVFFAFAFMQYFIIFTDYGFELSATREIAINRHNKNNLSNIFSSVTFIKIGLLLISFLILLVTILFIPKFHENWLIFILSFLMVVGNAIYPVWFFQGMEKMKYITFLNVLAKTLFLIFTFIFVREKSDYVIVPLLNSLGFVVAGIVGIYFAIRYYGIHLYIPKWSSIKKQFNYSTGFFLSRFSVTALGNTNTFFLGLISSNTLVGYYVAAEKICIAIKGLQVPIKNSIYPFIAKNQDIALYKKIFVPVVLINTIICLIIFILSKEIIILFYGNEMLEAYKILRIFCIVVIVTCPSTLLGYPLLGAMGFINEANKSVIIASITHIIGLGILYLMDKITPYSIAYMVLCSETLLFLQWSFYIIKYKLLKSPKGVKHA